MVIVECVCLCDDHIGEIAVKRVSPQIADELRPFGSLCDIVPMVGDFYSEIPGAAVDCQPSFMRLFVLAVFNEVIASAKRTETFIKDSLILRQKSEMKRASMRGASLIRSGADDRAFRYCEFRKRNNSFSFRLFFGQISMPVGMASRILWSSRAKSSESTMVESLCMEMVHPMSTPTWSGLRYVPILYTVPTLQALPA